MDDQLYSMRTDFYINLETKDNNNIFLSDALKDVEYLLGKYGLKNYYITEYREFRSGTKKKGLRVSLIHPHQEDGESVENTTNLCDVVARDFRSNFRLPSVLLIHSEVAGRLIVGEELPDA